MECSELAGNTLHNPNRGSARSHCIHFTKPRTRSKKKSRTGWKRNSTFEIMALGQFLSQITSAIKSGQKDVVTASEQFESSISTVPYERHFLWPQMTMRTHCFSYALSSKHLTSATVAKSFRWFFIGLSTVTVEIIVWPHRLHRFQ